MGDILQILLSAWQHGPVSDRGCSGKRQSFRGCRVAEHAALPPRLL